MGFKHGVNFLTVLAMPGVCELLPTVSVGKQRCLEHKMKNLLAILRTELQDIRFIYNWVPREVNIIFLGSLPWLIKGMYLHPNHPRWKSSSVWSWFPGERWRKALLMWFVEVRFLVSRSLGSVGSAGLDVTLTKPDQSPVSTGTSKQRCHC